MGDGILTGAACFFNAGNALGFIIIAFFFGVIGLGAGAGACWMVDCYWATGVGFGKTGAGAWAMGLAAGLWGWAAAGWGSRGIVDSIGWAWAWITGSATGAWA